MTDPRDLAERICEELFEGNPAVDTPYELMCVERILREDREALAQAMVVPEYEHWSPKWVEDTKDFGIWWMSIRAQKILRGEIVLKGGEQAERNQDDATSDPRDPAAPDPHEFVEPRNEVFTMRVTACKHPGCARPADDPIHTQVTNYDAEAEAKTREVTSNPSALSGDDTTRTQSTDDDRQDASPAYVGPGDEVQVHLENLVLEPTEVVGPNRQVVGAIVVQLRRGVFASYMVHYLRTPDGRPVAGFREGDREALLSEMDTTGRLREICAEKCKRIAELERELADKQAAIEMNDQDYRKVVRERDEARAERDRLRDD